MIKKQYIKQYFSLIDETIKTLTVKLGYNNLDGPTDVQSVEKSVQLIIRNQNFSMDTLVSSCFWFTEPFLT